MLDFKVRLLRYNEKLILISLYSGLGNDGIFIYCILQTWSYELPFNGPWEKVVELTFPAMSNTVNTAFRAQQSATNPTGTTPTSSKSKFGDMIKKWASSGLSAEIRAPNLKNHCAELSQTKLLECQKQKCWRSDNALLLLFIS